LQLAGPDPRQAAEGVQETWLGIASARIWGRAMILWVEANE
jgi:hypothetical protein